MAVDTKALEKELAGLRKDKAKAEKDLEAIRVKIRKITAQLEEAEADS